MGDIGARAYENVKSTWIKQKIWDRRWSGMPGMIWIHEEPDDDASDISTNAAAASANGSPRDS